MPTSVVYRTEGRRSASAKASNDGVNTVDEPAAIEEIGGVTIMNIADLDIGSLCEYGGVENEDVGGGAVQIANPFADYASLDDAALAAQIA